MAACCEKKRCWMWAVGGLVSLAGVGLTTYFTNHRWKRSLKKKLSQLTGLVPEEERKEPIQLGYWKISGLANPIRLLLEYGDLLYEEKRYECGDAPEFDKTCWLGEKFELGLDFPNLPYMFDGAIRLTESGAILRHIARELKLYGRNEKEAARIDMFADVISGMRMPFYRTCYTSTNFEEDIQATFENARTKIAELASALGDGEWITDRISFADFLLYEFLRLLKLVVPEKLAGFANLCAFVDRFEALPRIREYQQSDRWIGRPINNKMAKWR